MIASIRVVHTEVHRMPPPQGAWPGPPACLWLELASVPILIFYEWQTKMYDNK